MPAGDADFVDVTIPVDAVDVVDAAGVEVGFIAAVELGDDGEDAWKALRPTGSPPDHLILLRREAAVVPVLVDIPRGGGDSERKNETSTSHLIYTFRMATDRDSVLEAAVGVLSRRPTAHLDEIARAAGISRATLHRIFPGREALIREVGALSLRKVATALDTAAIEEGDAEAALRRLVDAVVPDAALCAFLAGENQLYDDPGINELWEVQDARIRALFLRGQQEGVFRIELSAGWLSEAFFDLVAGIGWAVQDGRLAPRDSAFSLAELFLGGTLRRTGKP